MEQQIILAVNSELDANTALANDVIDSHKSNIAGIKKFLQTDASQLGEKPSK